MSLSRVIMDLLGIGVIIPFFLHRVASRKQDWHKVSPELTESHGEGVGTACQCTLRLASLPEVTEHPKMHGPVLALDRPAIFGAALVIVRVGFLLGREGTRGVKI